MTDLQDLTIEEAKALIKKMLERKPSKYRNKKTAYGGRVYDSAREAQHAMELDARLKAGEFESWEPQVPFPIIVNESHVCTYIADFVLCYKPEPTSPQFTRLVIEEFKGYDLPMWKLKRKLLAATHAGLELRVIR